MTVFKIIVIICKTYWDKVNSWEWGWWGLDFNPIQNRVFFFLHIQFKFFQTKSLKSPGPYISGRTWYPSHYKIVDRKTKHGRFRGDLCKLLNWKTFINKQKE